MIWVVYVVIWVSTLISNWKRKNAEIATRWGVLDLMLSSEGKSKKKSIRATFIGCEKINDATGELNIVRVKNISWMLKLVIFLVMLAFFIVYMICFGLNIYFNGIYADDSMIIFFLNIGLSV